MKKISLSFLILLITSLSWAWPFSYFVFRVYGLDRQGALVITYYGCEEDFNARWPEYKHVAIHQVVRPHKVLLTDARLQDASDSLYAIIIFLDQNDNCRHDKGELIGFTNNVPARHATWSECSISNNYWDYVILPILLKAE